MKQASEEKIFCRHCKTPVESDRYIAKENGTYCCEHCYFRDTYLDMKHPGYEDIDKILLVVKEFFRP